MSGRNGHLKLAVEKLRVMGVDIPDVDTRHSSKVIKHVARVMGVEHKSGTTFLQKWAIVERFLGDQKPAKPLSDKDRVLAILSRYGVEIPHRVTLTILTKLVEKTTGWKIPKEMDQGGVWNMLRLFIRKSDETLERYSPPFKPYCPSIEMTRNLQRCAELRSIPSKRE